MPGAAGQHDWMRSYLLALKLPAFELGSKSDKNIHFNRTALCARPNFACFAVVGVIPGNIQGKRRSGTIQRLNIKMIMLIDLRSNCFVAPCSKDFKRK